ncbi:MAG TPA: Lpg1974 family pore-forming outer membrane protein [Rhabdochlamydiaceae bacterium]|nr:Lpg1974 family pore-forming outer membrane protein [Rhabdochlamydiaceae bacterium]
MNRLALFGLTALTISAFAEDEIAAGAKSSSMKSSEMQQQQPSINSLTTAAPKSDHGWYLFADALYWHASEGNTDWAFKYADEPAAIAAGPVHHLDFKWDWGFRVGIGMSNMQHDQWDSNFYYTWFHAHNSNSIGMTGAPEQVIDTWGSASSNFNSAEIDWNVHFSMFDWELGRNFFVSKNLALRPHIGIKGGWIHQPVKISYSGGELKQQAVNWNLHMENDFWGVGASGGVNTNWTLGNAGAMNQHRFSIFGDFSGALMYGHFDVDYKDIVSDIAGTPVHGGVALTNLSRNLAVTMLDAVLGLSWDVGFNQDRCHFAFRLGYEFQYWFRQNQLVRGVGQGNDIQVSRASDDLGLQGLTADFRFDF